MASSASPQPESPPMLFGTDRRVLALAFARMADALGNSFLIIVLPLYVASGSVAGDAFGLPTSVVAGLVLALFGIASSLAQPLAGRFSDRAGRRKVFVLGGLVVFFLANLAFVWAADYMTLFGLRIVQGLAAAFTITASIALVNEVSLVRSRGNNMGVYNSFRLIGFGSGPIMASLMIEGGPYGTPWGEVTGFEASFYVAAGAALASAVLVALIVHDPEETQKSNEPFRLPIRDPRGERLFDPIFSLGIATLIMAACVAILSAIEPEVNERLEQGPFLFSVEFVALIATLALAQPIVGRMSDQVGRKRFIVIGLIGLIPTTLIQGMVVEPWQMMAIRALQGIAGAMVFAPALALAGDFATKGQSGAQLSVLTVSFGLGIACGQMMAGVFVQYGFVVPFAIGSVLAAAGTLLIATQVEDRFEAANA